MLDFEYVVKVVTGHKRGSEKKPEKGGDSITAFKFFTQVDVV